MSDLSSLAAQRLVKLARLYRREIDRALAEYRLSDATAMAVLQIFRLGTEVRQRALAEELGIEGPSLVRVIDLLAQAGLVERHEDPSDRRAKTLRLTKAGKIQAKLIEKVIAKVRARLFDQIAARDIEACIRVFDQLGAAIAGQQPERP